MEDLVVNIMSTASIICAVCLLFIRFNSKPEELNDWVKVVVLLLLGSSSLTVIVSLITLIWM